MLTNDKRKREKPKLVEEEEEDHSLLGKSEPLLDNERLLGDEPILGLNSEPLFGPLFDGEPWPDQTRSKKTKREPTFWDW